MATSVRHRYHHCRHQVGVIHGVTGEVSQVEHTIIELSLDPIGEFVLMDHLALIIMPRCVVPLGMQLCGKRGLVVASPLILSEQVVAHTLWQR